MNDDILSRVFSDEGDAELALVGEGFKQDAHGRWVKKVRGRLVIRFLSFSRRNGGQVRIVQER